MAFGEVKREQSEKLEKGPRKDAGNGIQVQVVVSGNVSKEDMLELPQYVAKHLRELADEWESGRACPQVMEEITKLKETQQQNASVFRGGFSRN
jgi:hypothetical protein